MDWIFPFLVGTNHQYTAMIKQNREHFINKAQQRLPSSMEEELMMVGDSEPQKRDWRKAAQRRMKERDPAMEGALLTDKAGAFVGSSMTKLNLIANTLPLHLEKQKQGKMNNTASNHCKTAF